MHIILAMILTWAVFSLFIGFAFTYWPFTLGSLALIVIWDIYSRHDDHKRSKAYREFYLAKRAQDLANQRDKNRDWQNWQEDLKRIKAKPVRKLP